MYINVLTERLGNRLNLLDTSGFIRSFQKLNKHSKVLDLFDLFRYYINSVKYFLVQNVNDYIYVFTREFEIVGFTVVDVLYMPTGFTLVVEHSNVDYVEFMKTVIAVQKRYSKYIDGYIRSFPLSDSQCRLICSLNLRSDEVLRNFHDYLYSLYHEVLQNTFKSLLVSNSTLKEIKIQPTKDYSSDSPNYLNIIGFGNNFMAFEDINYLVNLDFNTRLRYKIELFYPIWIDKINVVRDTLYSSFIVKYELNGNQNDLKYIFTASLKGKARSKEYVPKLSDSLKVSLTKMAKDVIKLIL